MLSKIAIFLTLALFPMSTNAQLIGLENKKTDTNTIFLSRDDVKQKEIKQSAKNVKVPSADNSVSEEDEALLGEELPPPSTVTPSEIAELETSSKKKIRLNIKKQNKNLALLLLGPLINPVTFHPLTERNPTVIYHFTVATKIN